MAKFRPLCLLEKASGNVRRNPLAEQIRAGFATGGTRGASGDGGDMKMEEICPKK